MKQLALLLFIAVVSLLGGCSARRSLAKTETDSVYYRNEGYKADSVYRTYTVDSSFCQTSDVELVKVAFKADTTSSGRQMVDYIITAKKASQTASKAAVGETIIQTSVGRSATDSVKLERYGTFVMEEQKAAESGGAYFTIFILILLALLLVAAYLYRKLRR